MAGVLLPFLKWFIGGTDSKGPRILNCLVHSPWSIVDLIDQIEQPILFLSGSKDEMVPPSHMHKLYERVKHNPRCLFVEFPTGMHMDTWFVGGDRYWKTIQHFLVRELPKPEGNEEGSKDGWENEWGKQ